MTYCDMTAETGLSFRTDENTDGSTDGWTDRHPWKLKQLSR